MLKRIAGTPHESRGARVRDPSHVVRGFETRVTWRAGSSDETRNQKKKKNLTKRTKRTKRTKKNGIIYSLIVSGIPQKRKKKKRKSNPNPNPKKRKKKPKNRGKKEEKEETKRSK